MRQHTIWLQMIQEEERGNIQKAKQIQKTLDLYRGKQIKFYESPEVKQYIEK